MDRKKVVSIFVVIFAIVIVSGLGYWIVYRSVDRAETEKEKPHYLIYGVGGRIYSYDLVSGEKKSLREYPGEQIENISFNGSKYFWQSTTEDPHFYYLVRDKLVRDSIDRTPISYSIGEYDVMENITVSPQGDKVAWRNREGSLMLRNLPTTSDRELFSGNSLRGSGPAPLVSVNLSFSRDGKYLYYIRGFWEIEKDYTQQQIEELAVQNKNGLHRIDLNSGSDIWLQGTPPLSRPVIWSDGNVAYDHRLLTYPDSFGDLMKKEVLVKRLPEKDFDYLLPQEINALETVATLGIPNRSIQQMSIDFNGQGITFTASPAGEEAVFGREIGYFDTGTELITFPLVSIPSFHSLFASIDQGHFFYTTSELPNYYPMLYEFKNGISTALEEATPYDIVFLALL